MPKKWKSKCLFSLYFKNFEDKSDSFRKNGIVIVDIDLKNNKLMKQRLRELKGKNNYRFFSVPRHRE
jgi:hypothetical protein